MTDKAMEAAREIAEFLRPIDETNLSWMEKRSLIVARALLDNDLLSEKCARLEEIAANAATTAAAEITRLRADNARLEALRKSMRDELLRGRTYDERAEAIRDELIAALEGVIRVADRKTDEFDAARAALAKAKGADI
jgi:hypothetical protein